MLPILLHASYVAEDRGCALEVSIESCDWTNPGRELKGEASFCMSQNDLGLFLSGRHRGKVGCGPSRAFGEIFEARQTSTQKTRLSLPVSGPITKQCQSFDVLFHCVREEDEQSCEPKRESQWTVHVWSDVLSQVGDRQLCVGSCSFHLGRSLRKMQLSSGSCSQAMRKER